MPELERVTALPAVPFRSPEGHKGTYGHALIVAGSRGMSGAASLAGRSALRGGAGLVTVAVPAGIQPIVAGVEAAYMTVGLPETSAGCFSLRASKPLLQRAEQATAVAIGPGCGNSASVGCLVRELYASLLQPVLVDADGLNVLADDFLSGTFSAPGPRVLTPHPGEFARLLGSDTKWVQSHRAELAAEFAARHNVVLLLKGRQTVISDGRRIAVNTTGNAGMATGGTGDVLTGLIAALLAQGWAPFEAAQLGAHLHGLAGDLAVARLGQLDRGMENSPVNSTGVRGGMISSDLLESLPAAWNFLA